MYGSKPNAFTEEGLVDQILLAYARSNFQSEIYVYGMKHSHPSLSDDCGMGFRHRLHKELPCQKMRFLCLSHSIPWSRFSNLLSTLLASNDVFCHPSERTPLSDSGLL